MAPKQPNSGLFVGLNKGHIVTKKELAPRPSDEIGGRRFGGGRKPTGTPSLAWSLVIVVTSLLAGASIVHNIYKPNLALPPLPENGGLAKDENRQL